MSLLDLGCHETISLSKEFRHHKDDPGKLWLGHEACEDYFIYLNFTLPSYLYMKKIRAAKLIFFKIPTKDKENENSFRRMPSLYSVYPLLDYFSIFSPCYSLPRYDQNKEVIFENDICCSYSEIDITLMVKAWLKEEIENKGLVICSDEKAQLITYASPQYGVKGLHPFLRLLYEDEKVTPPLVQIPCSVKINR